jgi:dihydroorotase
VLFDVGHGRGAFDWRVAEKACGELGFWPDTISTDVHAFNLHGPVWDLPTTMSKFLYLGMPLSQIIRCASHHAARALHLESSFGLLQAGRQADITVLRLDETLLPLPDVLGATRHAPRLVPLFVWKRGEKFDCTPAAFETLEG